MSTVESELKEIKDTVKELKEKVDKLLEEREVLAMLALSDKSLTRFLSNEPDLYSVKDLKAHMNEGQNSTTSISLH